MTRLNIVPLMLGVFTALNIQAQDRSTINGGVTDSKTNEPLVGASIRISGTSYGTQSDVSGQFRLNIPSTSLNDSLVITYVGYKRYAEPISKLKNKSNLMISLVTQATTLKEVVVHSEFWRKQYSPDQLKEDYVKFCTIMEKVHTGLFDYLTEREWQALKDSSFQLFTYPMSHSEFYHLIALHVGKVRNIHTRHGVTDWWYRQQQNIFPFDVKYFGDRLYVIESLMAELDFPRGCEIIQINGKTPIEIKEMIWPFIPADGFNETGKMAALNKYFHWYFALFVEEAKDYTIEIKTIDGNVITITTSGLRDSFRHFNLQQIWKGKEPALKLDIDNKLRAAYFRIDDSRAFDDSLKNYIQRITGNDIQHLIIDLRGGGGMREEEQVAELYSYLIEHPSTICDSLLVKSNDYKLFDKDFTFKPYAKSLNQIRKEYFDKLVDSGDGYFLWKNESHLGPIAPANVRFKGVVYILTDGLTYSASSDFVSIASRLDNVYVIGEETGGAYRSYISGAMFGLELPNSKIGVKIPTWKSILAFKEEPSNRGRGVIPDYAVSVSLDDFIKGRDAVKEFAFELISSGRY
jgi:hypothetical protein